MKNKVIFIWILISLIFLYACNNNQNLLYEDEDGSQLWLRYKPINDQQNSEKYKGYFRSVYVKHEYRDQLEIQINELNTASLGFFGKELSMTDNPEEASIILNLNIDTISSFSYGSIKKQKMISGSYEIRSVNRNGTPVVIISGEDAPGILYGIFHFIRLIHTQADLSILNLVNNPCNQLRMVNHWDNPNGSIERGYAGKSIFTWEDMESGLSRIDFYARAMASIGINGIVINNVNASPLMLTNEYIDKYKLIADVFRKYYIRLYISANYGAPLLFEVLKTADPIDDGVVLWWKRKIEYIYTEIPDFGGFLVKADSEGQPGPNKYGRTHSEGANMLAKLLKPYGGLVIWRAFVYGNDLDPDRAKQSYQFFKPLDGEFLDNVILQVKNGPIDFQIREPIHPLIGAMPGTNLMIEFQTTQEYTGQQVHLNYLVHHYSEVLNTDTQANGEGSEAWKILAGRMNPYKYSGVTTVTNIGDDSNWTGHHLAQANLYGYGRLAWNPKESVDRITTDWIKMTFSNETTVVNVVKSMLDSSYKIYENYTTPLGCGYFIGKDHFSPAPNRFAGNYHMSDRYGMGHDRTIATGSGYTAQYYRPVTNAYEDINTCPEEQLLFFHHVPYTYILNSGKTLIQHIYDSHFEGAEQVDDLIRKWESIKDKIDNQRFHEVNERLIAQKKEAVKWRDEVNKYYLSMSGINDNKERLNPEWIENIAFNRLIYEIRNMKDIPVITIQNGYLKVKAHETKFFAPFEINQNETDTVVKFAENGGVEIKKQSPALIAFKVFLPWHDVINYYGVDKAIRFTGSSSSDSDTLQIKIDDEDFEEWVVNFEEIPKIIEYKTFGSDFGSGYHTIILKAEKPGLTIFNMEIEVLN